MKMPVSFKRSYLKHICYEIILNLISINIEKTNSNPLPSGIASDEHESADDFHLEELLCQSRDLGPVQQQRLGENLHQQFFDQTENIIYASYTIYYY